MDMCSPQPAQYSLSSESASSSSGLDAARAFALVLAAAFPFGFRPVGLSFLTICFLLRDYSLLPLTGVFLRRSFTLDD